MLNLMVSGITDFCSLLFFEDDELPDYIMVMLANKRSKEQMTEDLVLFLGANTNLFTDWWVHVNQRLLPVVLN